VDSFGSHVDSMEVRLKYHIRLPKNVSSPSFGDPQMCSPIEMLPLQNFTEMLAVLPFNFAQATCGPSEF